eukprot:469091-Pyramimonas_sp.AAC.1
MAVKALRRTKIGKFAPPWSAPSEIFKMIVDPGWLSSPTLYARLPWGVGARRPLVMEEEPRAPDPYARLQLRHLEALGEGRHRLYRLVLH